MSNDEMNDALRGSPPAPPPPPPDADRDLLARDAAAAHGLPADVADRLRGESADELAEDARAFAGAVANAGLEFRDLTDPPAGHLDGGVRQHAIVQDPSAVMEKLLRSQADHVRFGRDQ